MAATRPGGEYPRDMKRKSDPGPEWVEAEPDWVEVEPLQKEKEGKMRTQDDYTSNCVLGELWLVHCRPGSVSQKSAIVLTLSLL